MKNTGIYKLIPVERVEIVVVVDNYSDLQLTSTEVVVRPPLAPGGIVPGDCIKAEHGLSLLVTTFYRNQRHTVLFDTGYGSDVATSNLSILGEDLDEIESVIISHGHPDHTGALGTFLKRTKRKIDVVLHPDAFITRRVDMPDGERIGYARRLKKEELERDRGTIIQSRRPYLLAEGTIMVTGEIDRSTSFEQGIAGALIERNGQLEPDSFLDDQGLAIHLKDHGLVVISGCAHAGIINTILYAQKICDIEKIFAVLGGFHLCGPKADYIINETLFQMKKLSPEILVPMHCTGWKAMVRFSQEFPDAFVLSSVGTKIILKA